MTVAAARHGFAGVRWLLVFLAFVVAAVSYLDRNNISIAASAIQQSFDIGNVELGWIFSAFVMGYALTQPIAGRIADRYGPYRVIAFGLVWWSLFTVATALVPSGFLWSLGALMGVRFLLGIGEAVIFPASNRLVANWIPARERGLANGIIFAGVGIGAGVAPPLITFMMLAHGWQWAFYASALIGLAVLMVWLVVVRDRPEQHYLVCEDERRLIASSASVAQEGAPAPWRMIIRHRPIQLLAAAYFSFGYVAYIFFTWFFTYLSKVRGLDLKASALYGMLPFIAMAIASPLGGWIGDRLSRRLDERRARCTTAAIAMACAGMFVGLATQVDSAEIATLFLAGGAGALYLSQSAFWTLSAGIGGRSAGSVSGFMNMCNQIAGVITASLTPFLANRFGWTPSFLLAAAICLAGACAWLLIDPEVPLAERKEC